MVLQTYINKLLIIVSSIFLLNSCGIIGGKEKVDATENAVLSGPPLVIPPDFDVNTQNTNQQQSIPTYDLETTDQSFEDIQVYESNQNENIFGDEVPTMTNIFCFSFILLIPILEFNTFLQICYCNTNTIGVTYANE